MCVTDGSEWLWNLNLAIQWKRLLDYIFVWLLLLWYRSDQLESDPPPPPPPLPTHTHTHTFLGSSCAFLWGWGQFTEPVLCRFVATSQGQIVTSQGQTGAGTCVAWSPSTFCHRWCLPVESDGRCSLTLEAVSWQNIVNVKVPFGENCLFFSVLFSFSLGGGGELRWTCNYNFCHHFFVLYWVCTFVAQKLEKINTEVLYKVCHALDLKCSLVQGPCHWLQHSAFSLLPAKGSIWWCYGTDHLVVLQHWLKRAAFGGVTALTIWWCYSTDWKGQHLVVLRHWPFGGVSALTLSLVLLQSEARWQPFHKHVLAPACWGLGCFVVFDSAFFKMKMDSACL